VSRVLNFTLAPIEGNIRDAGLEAQLKLLTAKIENIYILDSGLLDAGFYYSCSYSGYWILLI